MTSATDGSAGSVPARVWQFLRGPRFIDLPIRLLALIMGLTILVPGSFETTEPLYSGLLILAYALIVVAAFLPLTTVIAATGLGVVFSQLFPDLQNMFPEALLLAIAVLISRRRWVGFAIGTAGLAGYLGFSTWLGSYDAGFEGLTDLGYGWLTYSLLGLCASFVEARIRREIARRERAAIDHQKTLDAMRTRFTSDMHDTISHSLTTESAIIRTLARETDSEQADRLLAELALVNAEATKRLRQLVTSLSSWETDTCPGDTRTRRVRFRAEAEQLAGAIEDGCAAGSVPLTAQLSPLPTYSSDSLAHHFRAILLELATNVIRHSTPGTPAKLTVELRSGSGDRMELVCRSCNESPTELTQVPRSLHRRATAVGGTCTVGAGAEKNTVVEVALPIRRLTPSAQAESGQVKSARAETAQVKSARAKSSQTLSPEVMSGTAEPAEMIDIAEVESSASSSSEADHGAGTETDNEQASAPDTDRVSASANADDERRSDSSPDTAATDIAATGTATTSTAAPTTGNSSDPASTSPSETRRKVEA
ncbi:histidine kinase [Brevibacterium spongiae]|uniref:histidine kinase n=1 Tax=Brevibacterium spongiae TaxID=2909672 RepID=A0ABY5SR44_9MICO|nr:histidine kinase [Brevibacterium spongiae]UVI35544.1 histidine kinase [Brevibacterium spongiae]